MTKIYIYRLRIEQNESFPSTQRESKGLARKYETLNSKNGGLVGLILIEEFVFIVC